MSFSIIIKSTYTTSQVGIYKNSECVAMRKEIEQASTTLIPVLSELLQKNNLSLENISYIGAYQGPGPFTTLRVLLASINGIAWSRKIPLVGIDGIDALLEEHTDQNFPITIALLNAYNNDAYFGIQHEGKIIRKGYENIVELMNNIEHDFPHKKIRFIGQGVAIFKDALLRQFPNTATIPSALPEAASLDMLAKKAYEQWQAGKTTLQLLPLYLKTLQYKKSITKDI